MVYAETGGDEVEDLHRVLHAVQAAIPDVRGVSTGSILSDYQRLRVEHVCERLGLTNLAYMWQRPQVRPCFLFSFSVCMAACVAYAAP